MLIEGGQLTNSSLSLALILTAALLSAVLQAIAEPFPHALVKTGTI